MVLPKRKCTVKETYHNGSKNGKLLSYYENGQLEAESYYDYGKKTGTWLPFYENGNIDTKTTYVNDKEHGIYKEYFYNGELNTQKYYIHGERVIKEVFDKKYKEDKLFYFLY